MAKLNHCTIHFPRSFSSYCASLIFLGDSDVASIVMNESEAEGEEARNFLEDVRITFPQVYFLNVIMCWNLLPYDRCLNQSNWGISTGCFSSTVP